MGIPMPLTLLKTNKFSILLGVLIFIAPLSARASVGTVTEQIGQEASISRDSDTIIVGTGTGINMNDTITTSKAKLKLTFEDNTKVLITQQYNYLFVILYMIFLPISLEYILQYHHMVDLANKFHSMFYS